jgi:hypothetical protein
LQFIKVEETGVPRIVLYNIMLKSSIWKAPFIGGLVLKKII